jgi:hypothetical protein
MERPFRVRSCLAAVAIVAGVAFLTACAGQPGAQAKSAAWTDFILWSCSPDDLSPARRQAFQNQSMGIAAFLSGMDFTHAGGTASLEARGGVQLRGVLMREAARRDGLTVWRIEGQAQLPALPRAAPVRRTSVVEFSTLDPELAPSAYSGAYPVNQVALIAVRRAVEEARQAGMPQGTARIASLQYDSRAGRFRARVEIL